MVDPEHTCHFRWDIHHPLVHWNTLNAAFCDGSLPMTQWKVSVKPLTQTVNYCAFEFRLEFDRSFDERDEIVANRVKVSIFMNDTPVANEDLLQFRFSPRNLFTYKFQTEVKELTEMNTDLLVVAVTLHLPGQAARNLINFNRYDIKCLSDDLFKLFFDESLSNMRLRSSDGKIKNVHSCIIHLRWNNFRTLNPSDAGTADAVQTNISCGLLFNILIYLYCGRVLVSEQSPPYFTELFHVINQYKLYHLYKALVKNDLHQKLVTRKDVVTESHIFPLTSVLANPIRRCSRTWGLNPNTPFPSDFSIKVEIYNGPWLSYSLKSKSSVVFYAQVNLDLGKKVVERDGTEPRITHRPEHQCDYTILPFDTVKSGAVVFIGCPEIFGDRSSVDGNGRSRQVEYFVRCTLKFTDGNTICQIQSIDNELRDDLESLNLLADHLLQLRRTTNDVDLQILPRSGNENQTTHYYTAYIHKAIFAARVPKWREVFVDIASDEMSDVATSILSSEALPYVLDYIYTSRAHPIPYHLLHEISNFATVGACPSLVNWVLLHYRHFLGL